jgi:arginine decarboxylase
VSPSPTPIYTALNKYIEENVLRLHMPGHAGISEAFPLTWAKIASFDVTEIPGLDDLHLPTDAIKQAEQLLAQAFGAQESFFLVNGATSGIHALFLTLPSEAQVLIPRHSHRSFFGGMVLSGVKPVYLPAEVDAETGLSLSSSVEAVEGMLQCNDKIAAVFLTSPTYYGTTSNISGIAAVAHRREIPVYVDEAHGAHFCFHSGYPTPALQEGADAVVHGLHKTLPVFNQGGALHLGQNFDSAQQIKRAYSILTTTSPSYPLLASMDLARHLMQQEGQERLEEARLLAAEYREKIDQLPGLKCLGARLPIQGVQGLDPLKVLVLTGGLRITGFEVGRIMRQQYNIQVEVEGDHYILAMMSMFHQRRHWERFYRALLTISKEQEGCKENNRGIMPVVPPAPVVMKSPREAFYSESTRVPLAQARNRVSAEIVAAYPPGIPCLLPGEMITEEIWDYLHYIRQAGFRVQGPLDYHLDTIAVLDV